MLGKIERATLGQRIFFYVVLSLMSAFMIYPFFFALTTSLKDSPEVFTRMLDPFGKALRFDNYATVLETVNMGRYMLNTTIVAVSVAIGQILTSVLGGYAFARIKFPGRDTIFRIYLGTIMIPFVVLMVPTYKMMLVFGWINKLVSLIVPWIFTAYGTFLMRQFFIGLPKELEEAAIIDGASRITILRKIFVPMAYPAIATQFTISFLYAWNSFIWPLVAITGKANYVVTLGLADIQGGYHANPPIVMAGAMMAILPTVLVFLLAQRYFVEGISTTGIKG
jgi:multiple sugar transport system permease protein